MQGSKLENIKRVLERYFEGEDVACIEVESEFECTFSRFQIIKATLSRSGTRYFYLKNHKYTEDDYEAIQKKVQNEYEATSEAAKIIEGKFPGSTINMISLDPAGCSVLSEKIDGVNLDKLIAGSARLFSLSGQFQNVCQLNNKVGKWLRAFQDNSIHEGSLINIDEMREYNMERINSLREFGFFQEKAIDDERLVALFNKLFGQVKDSDLNKCVLHGDFGPFNIMADGDRIVVVDFEMSILGSFYHDAAYYLNNLDEFKHKIHISDKKIDKLKAEFLCGLDRKLDADEPLFVVYDMQVTLCKTLSLYSRLRPKGILRVLDELNLKHYINKLRKHIY